MEEFEKLMAESFQSDLLAAGSDPAEAASTSRIEATEVATNSSELPSASESSAETGEHSEPERAATKEEERPDETQAPPTVNPE